MPLLAQTPPKAPHRSASGPRWPVTPPPHPPDPTPPPPWPLIETRPGAARPGLSPRPPAPSQDPSDPTRPALAGSNEALSAFTRLPARLARELGRDPVPSGHTVFPRPPLLPLRGSPLIRPRARPPPSSSGALGEGCGHSPLGCPPGPPHLAGRLARAPTNRTDPPSLARAQAQYVAGGERRGAGIRRKSVLSLRLGASVPTQDACATSIGRGLNTPGSAGV